MKSIAVWIDKRHVIQFINLIRQCNKIVAFARSTLKPNRVSCSCAFPQIICVWVSTSEHFAEREKSGEKLDPIQLVVFNTHALNLVEGGTAPVALTGLLIA